MKHGPIALIDESMPVVVIVLNIMIRLSNIQEIKSRSGRIIAVVTKGDKVRELVMLLKPRNLRCFVSINYNNTFTAIVLSYCGIERM
jgi:glucosamine 6-phosphate synthetase-like amidotransferase/phosphosugar isomerase protein